MNSNSNIETGLSIDEVNERKKKGLSNVDTSVKPDPVSKILKKNFFTLFNLVNFTLAFLLVLTKSFQDLTFMITVLSNFFISFIQEIRAKNATEKLKIVSFQNTKVIRESKKQTIQTDQVVKDDILLFSAGDQIVADCIIVKGTCEVNEALLTGESNLITKNVGDKILSGSFVISGDIYARAFKVGRNTYSFKISKGLKNIQRNKSEIMITVQKIVKIVSIVIIPIGIPLFLSQMKSSNNELSSAISHTSAALIGLIPEGIALLTSSVLALGALRLAKKNILAKDIYSVESLARIDTLCLDKTGTITEGSFEVQGTVSLKNLMSNEIKIGNFGDNKLFNALEILSSSFKTGNETFMSIKNKFGKSSSHYEISSVVPFASHRKFSSVFVKNLGSFIMGSYEFIFKNNPNDLGTIISKYSDYRVLSVAYNKNEIPRNSFPDNPELLGIVLLSDKIRKDASETIDYFQKHNVNVKIISGDNPNTISKIAKKVGLRNYQKSIDVQTLNRYSDILKVVNKYSIFARVTPERKREIIMALKVRGHKVSMIGDGVNDILALKESDCSISVASGSSAARNISQLILMDSSFSSLKNAVFEGRRAINNIQTTSSLFLVKTIYSGILIIISIFFGISLPFKPRQLALISALTVGIPSFLLALEPNASAISKSVFSNILKKSLPAAITISANIIFCFILKSILSLPPLIYSSISVGTTAMIGFELLWKICQPLNIFRTSLFLVLMCSFITIFFSFGGFFEIEPLRYWGLSGIISSIILMITNAVIYRCLSE